ncbi:hypothetical protein AX16_004426 [Volvariella volvacea WC 439]|nr:hypothetical protein AX16_004426 [Volvariella volvacea WC 439]
MSLGNAEAPLLSNNSSVTQTAHFPDTEVKPHNIPPKKKLGLRPRVYWPIVILTGQLIFLTGAWTFYGITRSRPIPLPDYLADAIFLVPQLSTYVVTLIASTISLISGYLYSHALRWAVTSMLAEPISLYSIHAIIRLAGKSPIKDTVRLTWTLYGLIALVALTTQTAGWTTLLTPRRIQLLTPMTGFGLDLSSDEFALFALQNAESQSLIVGSFRNVSTSIQDSGQVALNSDFGTSRYFDYNQIPFAIRTGGVLPANLVEIPSILSADSVLPVNIVTGIVTQSPQYFSRNYTVTQQGFSANVTCEQRELTPDTSPSLVEVIEPFQLGDISLIRTTMRAECGLLSGESVIYSLTNDTESRNGLFFIPCLSESENDIRFDFIIKGTGDYSFVETTFCNVVPMIVTMDVEYQEMPLAANKDWPYSVQVLKEYTESSKNATIPGAIPIALLGRAFDLNQGWNGHPIGDNFASIFHGLQAGRPDLLNRIIETYILGVLELGGTIIRAIYTQTNTGYFDGSSEIPESMRYTINGTFSQETLGWYQESSALPGVLMAPTFVMGVSILIVIYTLIKTRHFKHVDGADWWDSNNILHVIAAASAGGIREEFPPYHEEKKATVKRSEKVLVKLDYVPEADRIGLVQM